MRYALSLVLLYVAMAIGQPMIPAVFGERTWLIGLSPLLLVYCALRAPDFSLMLFVILGGVVHDLILLHYIGMGPLLWLMTVFIVRSQQDWLRTSHWVLLLVVCFAASFFHLAMDRIFFLAYNGFWSWNFELSTSLLKISTINALLSPVLFWILDFVLRTPGKKSGFVGESRHRFHRRADRRADRHSRRSWQLWRSV
jgi:cell shape-determining protein MreD